MAGDEHERVPTGAAVPPLSGVRPRRRGLGIHAGAEAAVVPDRSGAAGHLPRLPARRAILGLTIDRAAGG
jgi:hypothetical protein